MYNGIGLLTARGSGTNGYVQTSKFHIRPRPARVEMKQFEDGQGLGGVTRRANEEILEHDRKRQVALKLAVLEETLLEQGYESDEISEKLADARNKIEKAEKEETNSAKDATSVINENESHQMAARKEKKMANMKLALGLGEVKEGEAFDRDLQELKRQERMAAREEIEREKRRKDLEEEKARKREIKEEERRKREEKRRRRKEEKEARKDEERKRDRGERSNGKNGNGQKRSRH